MRRAALPPLSPLQHRHEALDRKLIALEAIRDAKVTLANATRDEKMAAIDCERECIEVMIRVEDDRSPVDTT